MGKKRSHDGITYERVSKKGERYKLLVNYSVTTKIKGRKADTGPIKLSKSGRIILETGYRWDGPSGPVRDRKDVMRASLVHDALYELMRKGKIKRRKNRKSADKLFRDMCVQDGMSIKKARALYVGLRVFGRPASR